LIEALRESKRPIALEAMLWLAAASGVLAACAHEEVVETAPAPPSRPRDPCLRAPWDRAPPEQPSDRDFAAAQTAFRNGLEARDRGGDPTAAFARAVELDPTFGLAHLELATEYLRSLNPSAEPIGRHVARAVLLLPDNPRGHELFARWAEMKGNRELAARHYRCALDRKASLDDARYRLAVQLFELGRYGEAGAELRNVVSRDPSAVSPRVLLAQVLEAEDRLREAAQQLETAARHAGSNPVLLRRAAALYARAGEDDDADRLNAEADARDPPESERTLRPLLPSRR